MKKNSNKGVALISVLAVTAVVLVIISTTTFVSVINSRIGLDRFQSQKTFQGTEALIEEVILKFVRWRNFTNPYPDWTSDCLQIKDFECKMELSLDEQGGIVDAWGKVKDKIRHLQVKLDVNEDQEVSISTQKEVY